MFEHPVIASAFAAVGGVAVAKAIDLLPIATEPKRIIQLFVGIVTAGALLFIWTH